MVEVTLVPPCQSLLIRVGVREERKSFLALAELGDGDAVHVGGTLLGKSLAHGDGAAFIRLVLGLTNEAGLLELLEAVADVLTSSHSVVLSLDTVAGSATEVLAESLDTNLLSHVELVADGSGTSVNPVIVIRVQFLVASGLNCDGPLLNIILIRTGLRKSRKRSS